MPAAALERLAGRLSTRSLQIIRNCLERASCHAEIRDLVAVQVGHRKASVSNSPPAWDTIPGPLADTVIFGRRLYSARGKCLSNRCGQVSRQALFSQFKGTFLICHTQ